MDALLRFPPALDSLIPCGFPCSSQGISWKEDRQNTTAAFKQLRVEEGADLLHGFLGGRIRTEARKLLGATSSSTKETLLPAKLYNGLPPKTVSSLSMKQGLQ